MVTQSGKPLPARQPGTWVIPTPSATESPTTVLFRAVNTPSPVIIRMPVMVMAAKTESVAPPMTHCGMVVRAAASLGISPATNNTRAAKAKTARLITLFTVTIPTFWL